MREFAIIVCLTLLLAMAAWRRRINRSKFLARCQPTSKFIGRDLSSIMSEIGPYTANGSMDFGEEVAQWKKYGFVLELWFKRGRCVSVEIH